MSSDADVATTGDRGRPIVVAIVALVVGAVLASTAILFAVTYRGPPPMPMPTRLDDIAERIDGQRRSPDRPGPPMPRPRGFGDLFGNDRRRLTLTTSAAPPRPSGVEARLPPLEARLAALLGTPPDRVIILSDRQPPFLRQELAGDFTAAWRAGDGWRIVRPGPRPLLSGWHKATLLAMLIAVLALAIPAWIIARAITRPLRQLAAAAEAARAGARRPDFPQGGPGEVRALTAAVATMHDRLAQHAEGRTAMLAAIAHDLGTPLSRLSFWIEHLPDAARERAERDIDEMRSMIRDTLAFARGEASDGEGALVDLSSLLDSLAEDMRVGGSDVAVETGARMVVRGDPQALRRAFTNLVGNAIRYGDRACVRARPDGNRAVVTVEDDGPGIDPLQAERLFEPFVRGEASRNRATGGTGLGLAIVRSVAARHGGTVSLANRPGGGGIATVTLPLAR